MDQKADSTPMQIGPETPSDQVKKIKDHLRGQILRGELLEGSRLVEEDIKRSVENVTHRVIRTALLDLTKEGLLTRRRHVGTIVAHKATSSTVPPMLTKIGLLTSLAEDVIETGRFMPPVIAGMREALQPRGEVVMYANAAGSHATIDRLPLLRLEDIRASVQGIVAVEANNGPILNDLARAGIPIVAIDYWPPKSQFDAVVTDYEEAGYLATAHLHSLGHRRVGFIGEAPNHNSTDPSWQDRLAGYLRAMAEFSGAHGSYWILNVGRNSGSVHNLLPTFQREHRLTGYVLCTGGMLLPAVSGLKEIGLECPKDVSLTSSDGTKRSFMTGYLSTVEIDYGELGRRAIRLLVARLMYRAVPPLRASVSVEFHSGNSSQRPDAV